MSRRATIALIDLLLDRMLARGFPVEAVEIAVDGAVRVLTHRPAPGVAVNDDDNWVELAGAPEDLGRA